MPTWLQLIITSVLFFFTALIQNSFLPHVNIMGITLNLVFILFFVLIFFEKTQSYSFGLFWAILAGLFLDISLPFHFGVAIISLVVIYISTKITLYFLQQRQPKNLVFYFTPLFLGSFFVYQFIITIVEYFPTLVVSFNATFLIGLVINGVVALIVFFIYKNNYYKDHQQLRLF